MPAQATSRVAKLLAVLSLAAGVDAQLRPRRVGTNALGEQEVEFSDVPTGGGGGGMAGAGMGGDAAADPLAAMRAAMGGAGGLEGLEGLDMASMLKNNPLMKQMAEAMGDANPEVAELLNNPEALQEQMAQVQQLMSSPEGTDMMTKMMTEMQSVLTCAPCPTRTSARGGRPRSGTVERGHPSRARERVAAACEG